MTAVKELRDLTDEELLKKLEENRKSMFEARFKKSLHQLENPLVLRKLRREFATMKTVLRERQLQEA